MPKRTKMITMEYRGLGNSNLTVSKSKPMQALASTELTLPEFKILDAYLGRINSHDPSKRLVKFEKGELEQLLGVTQIHREDLIKRINNLFQVVTIQDENKPQYFTKIALFSKADCQQDDDGLWQVELSCSPEAMEYIFNIDNIGYLRYRLSNVINLTSRYSYILFLYLEDNRFRKSWSISIDELKELLNCKAERYDEFKFFHSEILKKCEQEINSKTDCKFYYELERHGRQVRSIWFTVLDKGELRPANGTSVLPKPSDAEAEPKEASLGGSLDFLHDAVPEFTETEFTQIFAVLTGVPDDKLPMNGIPLRNGQGEPDLEMRRYSYLMERLAAMNVADSRNRINNRFQYFLAMLRNDAKSI